jgi:Zn-dependent metalloprotease
MLGFVPPYLLDRLAAADDAAAPSGRRTVAIDSAIRAARAAAPAEATATGAAWQVHDAGNTAALPGELVRSAGEPESGDVAVDEAAAGVEATLALLRDWERASYDDRGATVIATVHYERDYDNAFWDGRQLVFGDGDGRVFERFTKPIDVVAHELAHALVEHTAGLAYRDQPGALNESVADVVGACVKQRVLGQSAADADWLIGEGLFRPGVDGRALRSMAEPGTAYDDPRLGRDPQVGSMSDYVETTDDNGGVHINSGIPNRAFHLAATSIGGDSWAVAGRIWYAALVSGIGADTDFAGFAAACVAAAGEHESAVRSAWEQVGVVGGDAAPAPSAEAPAAGVVRVRRSGGVTGIIQEAEVDLAADDDLAAGFRTALARVDLQGLAASEPRPDRFVYAIELPSGVSAVVGEADLPADVADLVRRALS